jgi:ankyrin repeat protein
LGYACESGHTEVAEILINAGAHIDDAENEGRTPLMKSSRAGHTCTVRYLISKGKYRLLIFISFKYFH